MKVAIKTLGCKVNQYESEMLKECFKERGFELATDDELADVFVINTCSVTNLSDRKSRQIVRSLKKQNANAIIAMTGCYAQLKPEEVLEIDGVDIVTGTNHKTEVVAFVEEISKNRREKKILVDDYKTLLNAEYAESGIIKAMDARSRAYIKIEEGCDRYCSYCIIPFARGKVRSRDIENIVLEAKELLKAGFKEIVLTGINTALYAQEGVQKFGLFSILERLEELPYDFRIRIGSLEPTVVDAARAQELLKFKKLCPHFHLSVQSGSDEIVKAMNRHYTISDYLKILDVLRAHDSGFGITTDIIVGFPGETDED
ncbi:MAG: MiaB/RimO family radical SAM methylthiotransferase, partial [Eubacteriales bacterium]